jgi:hypothetical protein
MMRQGHRPLWLSCLACSRSCSTSTVAGSDYITEAAVTYGRLDGETATVPVVSICHADRTGPIDDYRVFFDLAPGFA